MGNILLLLILVIPAIPFCKSYEFDDGKAGFSIKVNDEVNPYRIYSVFLLPGTEFTITGEASLKVTTKEMKVTLAQSGKWTIISPSSQGVFEILIENEKKSKMHLNVLSLTPVSQKKGEYLNGYRIGFYPSRPLNGNLIYNSPKGFFEVTSQNQDLQLTPHFTVRQFVCKQASGFPRYLILRERLLLKLEYLLELVNENGYAIDTFGFISGYRTPYYNKQIKNVQYSRHIYGGAADIFIDQNKDGSMDDLNKDGLIDERDVRIFYDLVNGEYNKSAYVNFRGGLGFYKKNSSHNGFIHVDVRGWQARW